MDRSDKMDSDDGRVINKLHKEVHSSSSSDSDREEDDQEVAAVREGPPLAWTHHPIAAAGFNNRRRLLSKQLSMKETTREAKWEKRRRQILLRNSMVAVKEGQAGGEGRSPVDERVRPARPERARCLTDEDLDELRGSFELGFGFDEENGGADLCDTLPALDFYFAVNRQLSDPKLRTLAASPKSTLSASSSSSTLSGTPSPRSPHGPSASADAWKMFTPGDNPQLIKTRLRHWAQVVACSVKHGC